MRFSIDAEFLVKADSKGREAMRSHLISKHPEIRETLVARSILSRPIEAYLLGSGKRYVTLFAAHHALESITTNFLFIFMDYLMSKSQNGSINGIDCKLLLSKFCFFVVPCVNPDGVELRFNGMDDNPLSERLMRMSGGNFSRWQANARGVDLNHNYDFRFAEYKLLSAERGIDAGETLYCGEYPESEPETGGVANAVRTLMPFALISLHTQGEEIYAYPNVPRVQRAASRICAMTGYTVASADGTACYGGLSDYAAAIGIPSFTFELGRGVNPLEESCLGAIFGRVADAIAILPTLL